MSGLGRAVGTLGALDHAGHKSRTRLGRDNLKKSDASVGGLVPASDTGDMRLGLRRAQ